MICVICGVNETDNPDGICDDCKFSIITNNGIPPTF
jgi:NMD protein affecting ribosome stability and mRNA decay